MMARGLTPAETKHNGHRRAHFHDYNRPGVYMLTLVTEGRRRVFGHLEGYTRGAKGTSEYPHLHCSPLGEQILMEEVGKISQFYPMVEVCKVALMPDHIHLLVRVKGKLPDGKHLGHIVRGFKTGCTRAWWQQQDEEGNKPCGKAQGTMGDKPCGGAQGTVGNRPCGGAQGAMGGDAQGTVADWDLGEITPGTVPDVSPSGWRPVLFEKGYHDRIIIGDRMLENICHYMEENPFRAKLCEERPNLMQRRLHLWVHDREYVAFGNLFLLKNPDKQQVFFHRKNDKGIPTHLTPKYAQEKAHLLQRAEEGAVLVTPGISKGEQEVVAAALSEHLPLIILQKEPFDEYWKPPQGRFYACAAGRLLILAPWQLKGDNDYDRFHTLNELAHDICLATDTRLLES